MSGSEIWAPGTARLPTPQEEVLKGNLYVADQWKALLTNVCIVCKLLAETWEGVLKADASPTCKTVQCQSSKPEPQGQPKKCELGSKSAPHEAPDRRGRRAIYALSLLAPGVEFTN